MQPWNHYEKCVADHFRKLHPNAKIEHNVYRRGVYSQIDRQIDILIETYAAGFKLEVIIDCKYFSKKIDIGIVEQFISYLADIKAAKGIIITNVGFTEAALRRASSEGRDIDVQILDFEDLESFTGLGGALIHRDRYGAMLPCPSGWMIHPYPHSDRLCLITRPGDHWIEAYEKRELIYPEISPRSEFPSFEALFEFHRKNTLSEFPDATFHYEIPPLSPFSSSAERPLAVRRIDCPERHEPEITVFVQFEDFFLFLVLLAPEKDLQHNLKKIAFMAKMAIPLRYHVVP